MGASPDIKTLGQTNDAFQEYIDDRTTEMDKASQAARSEMDSAIKKFYGDGGWPLGQPVTSGSYQHLSTVSSWSLDNIAKMIDSVRGAIFGGSAVASVKDPNSRLKQIGDDAKVDKTGSTTAASAASTAAKKAANLVEGPEVLIAAAAFDAIQGILATFTTVTQTEISKDVAQKALSPGLDLWVTVMENAFHRSEFFADETIIQNFYIFDARMSVERGASQVIFDILQRDAELVAGYDAQNTKVGGALAALDIDDPNYDTLMKRYNGIVAANRVQIDLLRADIEKLKAGRNAANAALRRGRASA